MVKSPPGAPRPRRRAHFVSHEIAEYAIAAAVIAAGAHASGGLSHEFLVAGCLLGALNLSSKAPLGLFKVIGRHAHHAGDILIAVFLAASPFFGFVKGDIVSILCSEALAVLLIAIEQSTRYVDKKVVPTAVTETNLVDTPGASGSQNPMLASFGPIASRTVRTSARHLGILTGISRRTIRARKAQRSEQSTPSS